VIGLNRSITNVNQFADRLRHARKLRRLSQAALAAKCGLSQSAIANYETKNRRSAKDIFSLANALEVSPLWLAHGTGPMDVIPLPGSIPAYVVAESSPGRQPAPWPLPDIPPDMFWSLPEDERTVIQSTMTSLIISLRRKPTPP
jgi:transcriptional regulator with XRE-family HTH domain